MHLKRILIKIRKLSREPSTRGAGNCSFCCRCCCALPFASSIKRGVLGEGYDRVALVLEAEVVAVILLLGRGLGF
jgi:hypothetical protein